MLLFFLIASAKYVSFFVSIWILSLPLFSIICLRTCPKARFECLGGATNKLEHLSFVAVRKAKGCWILRFIVRKLGDGWKERRENVKNSKRLLLWRFTIFNNYSTFFKLIAVHPIIRRCLINNLRSLDYHLCTQTVGRTSGFQKFQIDDSWFRDLLSDDHWSLTPFMSVGQRRWCCIHFSCCVFRYPKIRCITLFL